MAGADDALLVLDVEFIGRVFTAEEAETVQAEAARLEAELAVRSPALVGEEALAGLPAQAALVAHADEPLRRRHALLAERVVERLGGVHVDVDADQVDQRARPDRPVDARASSPCRDPRATRPPRRGRGRSRSGAGSGSG